MPLQITEVHDYKDVNGKTEYRVTATFQGVAYDELYHTVPSDWPDQDAICVEFKENNPDAERPEDTNHLEINVRKQRDNLLAATDWWAVSDRTMTEEERNYRTALRDIPEQEGFPHNVVWPTEPEV